jgi:hypothetical protein
MSGLKESFHIAIAAGIVLAIAALLTSNSRISVTTSAAAVTKSAAPARG